MSTGNTPMSPLMRVVFWFVAANALAGALSLIVFPTRTDTLFFWEITPALNAALFGALRPGDKAAIIVEAFETEEAQALGQARIDRLRLALRQVNAGILAQDRANAAEVLDGQRKLSTDDRGAVVLGCANCAHAACAPMSGRM